MVSINHKKKIIFYHIPKTGGTYIATSLCKYYEFEFFIFKREDHDEFCGIKPSYYKRIEERINKLPDENKREHIKREYKMNPMNRKFGYYDYYNDSKLLERMNMTKEKWRSYKKFCFIRNPYDRFFSGYQYLREKWSFNLSLESFIYNDKILSDYEYCHLIMPQSRYICDENKNIMVDYIGRFEYLEEDFQYFLKTNGFEIKHKSLIINKINYEMNEWYDFLLKPKRLRQINKILQDRDFELCNISKIKVYEVITTPIIILMILLIIMIYFFVQGKLFLVG